MAAATMDQPMRVREPTSWKGPHLLASQQTSNTCIGGG